MKRIRPTARSSLRLGEWGLHRDVASLFKRKKQRVMLIVGENPRAEWALAPCLEPHVDFGAAFGDACVWIDGYPIPITEMLALLPGVLGHGLLTWAQPHVDLSVSSILLQGEPVGAAIAGMIFLGEKIRPIQAVGMTVAAVSLAILARSSSQAR